MNHKEDYDPVWDREPLKMDHLSEGPNPLVPIGVALVFSTIIATESSLSALKAEEVVNAIVDKLFETLQDGGRVELRGFGSFRVNEYAAYVGRNPKTGNIINVSQKKLPFFKPGKELREKVNSKKFTKSEKSGRVF